MTIQVQICEENITRASGNTQSLWFVLVEGPLLKYMRAIDSYILFGVPGILHLDIEACAAPTTARSKRVVDNFELRADQLHCKVHFATFE